MGRSQETFKKKEVRTQKEKKRKEKEAKRLDRKDSEKGSLDDMIAYVDENGMITSTPPDREKTVIDTDSILVSVPRRDPNEKVDPVRRGVVTFFNDSKGYGFIRDLETQESIFVHINNLEEPIKENNVVYFEVESGPKGLTAKLVRLNK